MDNEIPRHLTGYDRHDDIRTPASQIYARQQARYFLEDRKTNDKEQRNTKKEHIMKTIKRKREKERHKAKTKKYIPPQKTKRNNKDKAKNGRKVR